MTSKVRHNLKKGLYENEMLRTYKKGDNFLVDFCGEKYFEGL
jgi:hypothetical protein